MEQNKTGKYLKYAVGEIVLVMIGILLALQVNNWNETRKSDNRTIAILENIKIEIENDQMKITQMIKDQIERDKNGMHLSDFIHLVDILYDTLSLNKAFFETNRVRLFSPKNTAFGSLVNSGGINNIKLNALKERLTEYYLLSIFDEQVILQFENSLGELGSRRSQFLSQSVLRNEIEANINGNTPVNTFYSKLSLPWKRIKKDEIFRIALENVLALNIVNRSLFNKSKLEQEELLKQLDEYLSKNKESTTKN